MTASFQNSFFCGYYLKKDVAFTLISFAVLKWDDCLSVQLPFELPVQILIASRTRSELTLSKCEWTRIWTIKNVNETTLWELLFGKKRLKLSTAVICSTHAFVFFLLQIICKLNAIFAQQFWGFYELFSY